jgi:uncharacterized protein
LRPARVVVFARAPEPGRVKTRLAASIGDEAACAVYVRLGARVVGALTRDPARPYDVRVCFTPRGGDEAVRAWLRGADDYTPQRDGDLGERLRHEVDTAFEDGCRAVVLVGTDCLAVDDHRVRLALDALTETDAALGAAHDGGYYLLALARPLRLFEGVPWSTDAVAEVTRARLRDAGARWCELAVERDVDTLEDLDAVRDALDRVD